MKSYEFFLLAILCAVLNVGDPSWPCALGAYCAGLCGLLASFKAWRLSERGVGAEPLR